MNNFILKYPKILGLTKVIKRKSATSWNELKPKELTTLLALIDQCQDKYEFRIKVLISLLKLRKHHILALSVSQIVWLSDFFIWIEKSIELTKTPFKKVFRFYAPPDELSGLTAMEFLITDFHYIRFREGHEADLNSLIACMYRQKKANVTPGHDPRKSFDPMTIECRAKKIHLLNRYKKMAILRFYESCRQLWERNHPGVFSGEQTASSSYGWPEVFIKIAKSGEFGDLEKVENTTIDKVFMKMEIDIKDYEEFKLNNKQKT